MIVYLTTRGHRFTMRMYLDSWGRPLADRIVPLTYDDVLAARSLRAATYVFADLERLAPAEASAAGAVHEALRAHGMHTLNDPRRSLRRYDLLRALRARGSNQFAAYRVDDAGAARFPVFVRCENDHGGSRTSLLHDPPALAAAIDGLVRDGLAADELLVTEFCDTADGAGIYRKFSAFIVGDRVVPRHVFFSRRWMLKVPDLVTDALVAEERTYVETNPHEHELRAIFDLAGLEWGRIDYGVRDGALQIWEINTNPQLLSFQDGGGPRRMPSHARVAVALQEALAAIDRAVPPRRLRMPRTPTRPRSVSNRSWLAIARGLARRTGLIWHEERLRRWARPLLAARGRIDTTEAPADSGRVAPADV
ncbi:MAG TPA: hypothetical protein VFF00_01310 [Candidatus Elarobacter sp.]|nr:hypothetical protein [Candidatus Elarobacter sp.]